jgi:hypothetical protein
MCLWQVGSRENVQLAQLRAEVATTNTKLSFAQAEVKQQEIQFNEEYALWETKHSRLQSKHDECAFQHPTVFVRNLTQKQ